MAKEEWGIKRTCINCGARFYDLNHSPISCPKCETAFVPEVLLKSRRGTPEPVKVEKPPEAKVEKAATEEDIDDIPEAEDDDDDGAAAALLVDDDDEDEDVKAVVDAPARDSN